MSIMRTLTRGLSALTLLFAVSVAGAACVDSVVLVHGNTGKPSDWDNTYNKLRNSGYSASQIHRPDWGSKSCPSCNDHSGWEETPVRNALVAAVNSSCTGKIDVIAHSMGVTLAGQQIVKAGLADKVDAFVGVAGALRGLWSCGTYPWNVWSSTCGSNGLSVSSPFLDWLEGRKFGARHYSIYSWIDQIVCSTGTCTVGGIHSSQIWNSRGNKSYSSYGYGHFGVQTKTADVQYNYIR
ncbi:alpha/beta fold hydrolase [Alkalilimnicola sp. S0819]|uniref:alpha/beta fold hydrolase n=1 Tax=Alkalilimnicola sp. S0819 TaxID=2613922 RepID=UPI001D00CE94|nr:alpha/beta fold hydrolase [Alkalilimnicola sp. S0819]